VGDGKGFERALAIRTAERDLIGRLCGKQGRHERFWPCGGIDAGGLLCHPAAIGEDEAEFAG